jgi:hypothetical protein
MTAIVLRLYFVHIFAWLAVWLAMYYPGLDLLLSMVYLLIVAAEIRPLRRCSNGLKWGSFLIWQAPGIIFALISLLPWSWWGLKEYGFFLLQFWYTPVVPLLSLLHLTIAEYPLYYYLLLGMPLLLAFFFMCFVHNKKPVPRSRRIRYI